MSKKITLPRYEQMIMDIAAMSPEQLDIIIRCAKANLSNMRPRATRAKKDRPVAEKAS